MKKFSLLLMLFCSSLLISQTFSGSIKPGTVSTLTATNLGGQSVTSLSKDYIIEANKKIDNYLEISLKSSNQKTKTFALKPLSIDLFKSKFEKNYKDLIDESEGFSTSQISFNELEISIMFARLITYERTEENRPVVATLQLMDSLKARIKVECTNDSLNCWTKYKKQIDTIKLKSTSYYKYLTLKEVKLELTFYNGFIEKVELEGKITGRPVRFTNKYSIGISSSNGIRKFVNNKIGTFYKYVYNFEEKKIVRRLSADNGFKPQLIEIEFDDIIDYDREIDINANDISPEPTRLVLDTIQNTTKLYKEQATKLFEGVVFSDFLGVFDAESPNGILQTEVGKKFYIYTDRKELTKPAWGIAFFPIFYSEAIGMFEYIEVSSRFSKLEENNKFLMPEQIELNDNSAITTYFSPIKILQHQSFSFGMDLNLLNLENQNKKINTNLDVGLHYGRSGLQIEENTNEVFNTLNFSGMIGFHFIPEKRYGFIASNRISYYEIFNDAIIPLKTLHKGNLKDPSKWYNTTQLQFYVNTSYTGKLFIRYNFVSDLAKWDNNFSQFQFGYSFYILRQNGKIK